MKLCAVELCDKPSVCKNLCHKHYARLRRHGDVSTTLPHGSPRPVQDVLAEYVPTGAPNDCWNWLGHLDRHGYGVLNRSGKTLRAHRFVYEAMVGPIPAGLSLMHSCDNPPCVNPNHLTPGTNAENVADCVQKERHNRGEEMWSAKLTEAQVIEARLEFATGRYTQSELAAKYGLTSGPMSNLLYGDTWRHLPHAASKPELLKGGSRSHFAKLDEEKVSAIRAKYATGDFTQTELAAEYGLTPTPMSQLLRGVTWKHVPMPEMADAE